MTQQEYEKEIKEVQDVIKKAQDKLEQLKAAKIADGGKRWKPEGHDIYWVVAGIGRVIDYTWRDDTTDNWFYLTGNCFKTKEEAKEYKKQIEYTARYKNYIEEHSEPLDWKDNRQVKYGAYYDFEDKNISVDTTKIYKDQGKIYASSEQIIKDAIKEIGEDNFKKYVLGVK